MVSIILKILHHYDISKRSLGTDTNGLLNGLFSEEGSRAKTFQEAFITVIRFFNTRY